MASPQSQEHDLRAWTLFALCASLSIMAACGGGGSGSGTTAPTTFQVATTVTAAPKSLYVGLTEAKLYHIPAPGW
jgi:hypothetical protein